MRRLRCRHLPGPDALRPLQQPEDGGAPAPDRGTIIAWTTQGFPPKPGFQGDATGKNFQPFGVGLVQLGDVVRVETRLSESDPGKLVFGQEVELRIVPFFTDEDGDEIMTFEFVPVGA